MSTPKTPMERAREYALNQDGTCPACNESTLWKYKMDAHLAGATEEAAIKDAEITALESRIEKLRTALESYDFGPGTIGHDTLLEGDKAKEMSK